MKVLRVENAAICQKQQWIAADTTTFSNFLDIEKPNQIKNESNKSIMEKEDEVFSPRSPGKYTPYQVPSS